jgi:hypothetical protein
MEKLQAKTNIRRSNQSAWRFHLIGKPKSRARRSPYGSARRLFTDEQEHELATNYLGKGLVCSQPDFRFDALRCSDEIKYDGREGPLAAEEMEEIPKFTASHTSISAFRY